MKSLSRSSRMFVAALLAVAVPAGLAAAAPGGKAGKSANHRQDAGHRKNGQHGNKGGSSGAHRKDVGHRKDGQHGKKGGKSAVHRKDGASPLDLRVLPSCPLLVVLT
jgi:hypothetical protein